MKTGLILLLLIIGVSACVYPWGWNMMGGGHPGSGYGGVIMSLIVLVVLVGIVIYFIFNRNKLRQDYDEEDALEILKKRYAKGEITKKEFEEMKKDLI